MAKLTEKDGQKVIFRRVRGKIVPIKVDARSSGGFRAARTRRANEKKARSNILKGAGLLTGGIGLTVGTDALSGFILGKGTKKLQGKILAARDLTRVAQAESLLTGRTKPGQIKRAARATFGLGGMSSRLRALTKGTSFLKAGGLLIGSGAAGTGIAKLTEGLTGQDNNALADTVSHVVGVGATVVGAKALKRGLKAGLGKKSPFRVGKQSGQLEFKFETGQQF